MSLDYVDVTGKFIDPNIEKNLFYWRDQINALITQYNAGAASGGTVTTVSVVTANGISGSVANPTTTPAITLTPGALTPTSVAATGTVGGSNLSGTNTGDQTTVSGNAGTATALQNARTINGTSFDGTANINVETSDIIQAYQALGSTIKAQTVGGSIDLIANTLSLSSGTIRFVAVYLSTPQTIAGVKWYQSAKGNYTGNTSNLVGLYTYSAGTLTQVAVSTDDATLWQTASNNTYGSKAFSGTYPAAAGLYFVGLLYHQSAQVVAPVLGAFAVTSSSQVLGGDFTNSGAIQGTLAGQTTLPSPQAMSGLSASTTLPWVALY